MTLKEPHKTEIRFEVDPEELAIIDAHGSITGKCRTEVIRQVLANWSKETLHKATVYCRVAGVNPMQLDTNRNRRSEDK